MLFNTLNKINVFLSKFKIHTQKTSHLPAESKSKCELQCMDRNVLSGVVGGSWGDQVKDEKEDRPAQPQATTPTANYMAVVPVDELKKVVGGSSGGKVIKRDDFISTRVKYKELK
ncbi:hypothetical protein ACSLBF_20355 (plasmid) [Pseudoalteromonas sp. T1lg65]|uniref:hypothetical protein n=1 Tax=Pseudoalteromonas sp. T1lg65 TaxID=2077101 RepID=UPI003F796015